MSGPPPPSPLVSRRDVLRLGAGLGSVALASLLATEGRADPGAHFPAKAKRVIHLHMVGGTSHIDLFDPKPVLAERDGELCPDQLFLGKQLAFIRERPKLLGSPYAFSPAGGSGLEVSELLPNLKRIADDITVVRSMHTDQFNHGPAQLMSLTGFGRFGRPSIGAWTGYGLGSENEDLPAFLVLVTGTAPGAGNACWGSGFLPSTHAGVELRSDGAPVLFLEDPAGVSRDARREMLDTMRRLNEIRLAETLDPEIEARIQQYEMAFRMQASVPDVMDIWAEPESIHTLYGTTRDGPSFANNCLMARRLAERGVRFIQLFDSDWDHHGGVFQKLPTKCKDVDQAVAALVADLDQRGLLDDTLVVFSTEFGRTPMAQTDDGEGRKTAAGRDHHRDAYTIWLAGGGTKRGFAYGETDEFGHDIVANPVHVHDMNATILHLLGIDHEKLTYRHQGRDFRLTDVAGTVVHDLIA